MSDLATMPPARQPEPASNPPPAAPGRVALPVLPPAGREVPAESVTVPFDVRLAAGRLRGQVPVPAGPATPRDLLPVLQGLTETVVGSAVRAAEAQGKTISCKKGCGACCRQLVPISETEARRLRDLVDDLPEPRRSAVRARFADARQRLDAAGLLEPLRHPERQPAEERQAFGLEYFRHGIPCPFLEEESCSIHPDRPLICREYLVTSPAEHCARPSAESVRCVPLPGHVSQAANRLGNGAGAAAGRWVPLVLALEWASAHPDELPARPGPELLRELLGHLARKEPAAADKT
jgi:Fe-S-cluster containining protein